MKQWEYRVENVSDAPTFKVQQQLNELGAQGWELVSILLHNIDSGVMGCIFKRQIV